MRRLLIAFLASTFLCTQVAPARAEQITLAITGALGLGAIFTAGAGVTAVATFALTTAASYGLSLIANALKAKTPETAGPASGSDLNVQYGGNVPREVVFGTQATAGHLIYANVCGDETNNILQCVFVLSDGQCDGINKMWVNGELVTLINDSPDHYYADELKNLAGIPLFRFKFFDGRYDQVAHDELVNDANPPGRWTSNHRGRGVCYISVRQYYDEEHQLTGVPSVIVELRGNKLYDPRKDTTVGGSGAHRFGTPSTYEFSENPAIIEYNFRRGIRVNGQVLVGMDTIGVGDLILPMYFSAANDCEDAIPLLEGGTEQRYRCGLAASADKQHSTTLDNIRQSMAGFMLERAGQFGPIAGVAQSSVFEFSDSDFLVGAKATFSKYETRSNIATAVFGTFSDPAQKWAGVPFPPRVSTVDDALMGERLAKTLDLTQISSNAQAQRVAEIERRRSMMQAHGSQTLGADFIGIQPGDWGTYHSPYGDMTVQVVSLSLAGDDSVTFAWRQIASSVFSWTTAGELDPPAVPTGGAFTQVTDVAGFAVNPTQVETDTGLTIPALLCSWTPILDPSIARIDIEYRVAAVPGTVLTFQADTPSAGIAIISGSVQANTAYELRAKPIALPERTTNFTAWIAAMSGSDQVVLESLVTRLASFEEALRELVSQVLGGPGVDPLKPGPAIVQLKDDVEQLLRAISITRSRLIWNVKEVKDVIESRAQDAFASIEEVRTVATDADIAFADYKLTVTATFGSGIDASHPVASAIVTARDTAISTAAGALAGFETTVSTTFGSGIDASHPVSAAIVTAQGAAQANAAAALAAYTVTVNSTFGPGIDATHPVTTALVTTQHAAESTAAAALASFTTTVNATFGSGIDSAHPVSTAISSASVAAQSAAEAYSDSALSTVTTVLSATFGGVSGGVYSAGVKFSAGALARADGTVLAQAGVRLNAGGKATGYTNYTDGSTSNFDVETANFRVGDSSAGGVFVPAFAVATVNGSTKAALRGDMLIDGAILARHMTAGSINVGTVIADNIIYRGHLLADTATRLDTAQNSSVSVKLNGTTTDLVSLGVTSVGGQFTIICSVDLDFDSVVTATNASVADLIVNILIDGSSIRTILIPAMYYSGTSNSVRWCGHFEASIKVSLAAGSHTILLRADPPSFGGLEIPYNFPTIISFEARR